LQIFPIDKSLTEFTPFLNKFLKITKSVIYRICQKLSKELAEETGLFQDFFKWVYLEKSDPHVQAVNISG